MADTHTDTQTEKHSARTGIWLVGARGSVATTTVVGAAAIRARLAPPTGCTTEQPEFQPAGLVPIDDLVFGGHDVADTPLPKRADQLAHAGVVPSQFPTLVQAELAAADAEIRPGFPAGEEESQAESAARLVHDITAFRERHKLERVVVINLSSTEPPFASGPEHRSLAALSPALTRTADVLPPSSLYAYAAFQADCPYVEFTPSTGMRLPALDELARERGVPYAGSDGKTGETLMKSALAPMFASRALRVRSWSGTNLLGGGDGANLAGSEAATSKVASKQRAVSETLGYPVEGEVHIDYVAAMGDWKTAWDHVSFEGFLGTRMTLQFVWEGCDSALAAPLVLDLARLVARAHEWGESGPLPELAFFFKDPVAVRDTAAEHRLAAQYDLLVRFAARLGRGGDTR